MLVTGAALPVPLNQHFVDEYRLLTGGWCAFGGFQYYQVRWTRRYYLARRLGQSLIELKLEISDQTVGCYLEWSKGADARWIFERGGKISFGDSEYRILRGRVRRFGDEPKNVREHHLECLPRSASALGDASWDEYDGFGLRRKRMCVAVAKPASLQESILLATSHQVSGSAKAAFNDCLMI